MGTLLSDLRFALRTVRTNPGFSLTAIFTLALGIGAVSAMVSVVQAVLIAPFPFNDQGKLAVLWGEMRGQEGHLVEVSALDYWDWRRMNRSFTGLAALSATDTDLTYTGGDRPLHMVGRNVSANFFDVLGAKPLIGRTFLPAEDKFTAYPAAVVISYPLWQRQFGADPKVVGRVIDFDGGPATVVGVMPRAFRFPEGVEVWTPLAPVFVQPQFEGLGLLKAIGRLKPGVSLDAARADMALISRQLVGKRPRNEGFSAVISPLLQEILGDAPRTLWLLLGAVGLLLVIACTNVAGLLLARAAARQKETALRGALGAGRRRLARQLLTEGAVLVAFATALGLFFAWAGLRLLIATAPSEIPRLDEVHLNLTAIAITLAVAALTVLVFGLAPVASALGRDFTAALKEGGKSSAGAGSYRLRSVLVVAEVALALVLLVGAGLLIRSFLHLRNTALGFDPKNVLTFRITLPVEVEKYSQPQGWATFFREALEKVEALPGVERAGLVLMRPLSGPIGWDYDFTIEGQTAAEQEKNPSSNHQRVSPGYFKAMGTRLLAGRDFTWADGKDGERVLIVNDSTAKRYWPGQDPLGKRLRFGPWKLPPESGNPRWWTVIGVVEDAKYRDLGPSRPDLYVPFLQAPNWAMDVVLRTKVPPLTLADAAARTIQSIDKQQALAHVTTMDAAMSETIARPRLRSALLGTFAGLALVLAAVGLYGIIAYSVTQRRRELGIRTAIGADRPDLLRLILRFGLGLTAVGLAVGLVLAVVLAGTGWVDELLFGVKAADWATFAIVPLVLLAVAAFASFFPARRAMRADPLVALRVE